MSNLTDLFLMLKGGKGSGNFGHGGREGHKGGSVSRGNKIIVNGISDVQRYGIKTGKEKVIGYDINGGVIGSSEGDASKTDTSNIQMNSVHTLVHNHPSSASFSDSDVMTFVYNTGMKNMVVVGNDGVIYKLSKPDGWRDDLPTVSRYGTLWNVVRRELKEKYQNKVSSGENSNEIWKENTHEIMSKLAKETGLKYERKLPK